MDFTAMSDQELVAAWMDLREQVEAPTPQPLPPTGDVPDESVRLLTDLNLAATERVHRQIPAVDRRGGRFEVVRDDGEREGFESRGDAIARAVEIGEENRASADTAG